MKLQFYCPVCGSPIQKVEVREVVFLERPVFFSPVIDADGNPLLEITVGESRLRSLQSKQEMMVIIHHPSLQKSSVCRTTWDIFSNAVHQQFKAQTSKYNNQ